MKSKVKQIAKNNSKFTTDYNKIVRSNSCPIDIKTEWFKKGDTIQKFSMYDSNYRIIPNLDSIGSTTLIKELR